MKNLLAFVSIAFGLSAFAAESTGSEIFPPFFTGDPNVVTPQAVIPANDQVTQLAGHPVMQNIKEMDDQKLLKAKLDISPWSDSYWPMARGGIAARYADPSFPAGNNWSNNYQYYRSRPPERMIKRGKLDILSPAEKYDMLVGDSEWRLTEAAWSPGAFYDRKYGSVPGWMGICHGWAPASFIEKEPRHGVNMPAANGKYTIHFYPSDIKALVDQEFARGKFVSHFIGTRCESRNPSRSDPCFNNNSGTWHMAMVQMIGVEKRGFVMDANFNGQVWNQPVFGYDYQYFNPNTPNLPTTNLDRAMVRVSDYVGDPFRYYRATNTRFIVGVAAQVTYGTETAPSHNDISGRSIAKTLTYRYDLEMDADGNIIGGEWISKEHPGFLWTANPGTKPIPDGTTAMPSPSVVNNLLLLSQ